MARQKKTTKVNEYLSQKGISPVEKLIELMPMLPPEMQAILWRDILKHVDPPKEKPPQTTFTNQILNEQSAVGDVPKVIRVDHSEDELTRIVDGSPNDTAAD